MDIDFTPFFKRYEEISSQADEAFVRIKQKHTDCVKCKIECSDCCNALFDLSLIEAIYINHHYNKKFKGKERDEILQKSNRADRKTYMIKKKAHNDLKAGKKEVEILMELAHERVRCPLLNDQDRCDLYKYRPITCRLYGIPTQSGEMSHTCGLSGFKEGESYSTANLDIIHKKLYEISSDFVKAIKSKYVKMADMLVPLSMAILTDYNEEYLGLRDGEESETKEKKEKKGKKNE